MKFIRTPLFLLLLLISFSDSLTAQVQSPADFLGYEIGERWTPHHLVMDYMRHVADESDKVTLEQYGTTNENRALVYLVITSPENHENIEEIRTAIERRREVEKFVLRRSPKLFNALTRKRITDQTLAALLTWRV